MRRIQAGLIPGMGAGSYDEVGLGIAAGSGSFRTDSIRFETSVV
jgi:hypothetical protein